MTMRTLRTTVDRIKALGHPARLRILALLRGGDLCVCQVTAILGLAPSTCSEHLSLLRRAGLVEERKKAKWVFYRLADDPALKPLYAALWPLLEGDEAIGADARQGPEVRGMPIAALFKASAEAVSARAARARARTPHDA